MSTMITVGDLPTVGKTWEYPGPCGEELPPAWIAKVQPHPVHSGNWLWHQIVAVSADGRTIVGRQFYYAYNPILTGLYVVQQIGKDGIRRFSVVAEMPEVV